MKRTDVRNRIIAAISMLTMLLGLLVTPAEAFAASSVTQDRAVKWANSKIGKSLDYDKAYGAQCVDFIKYYYKLFEQESYAKGNAKAYRTNALPAGWKREKVNGDISKIRKGDILVWIPGRTYYKNGDGILKWTSCGKSYKGSLVSTVPDNGHVGVVVSVNSRKKTFTVVHQTGGKVRKKEIEYIQIIDSTIHPKFGTASNSAGSSSNSAVSSSSSSKSTGAASKSTSTSSASNIRFTACADKYSIGKTTATVSRRVCKPSGTKLQKYGVTIYDAKGNKISEYCSTPGSSYKSNTYVNMWYNIGKGQKVNCTLKKGTKYQFSFWAKIDGKTYTSSKVAFTTGK